MSGPLPRLLVLTDRSASAASGRTLPGTVELAVWGGARAVILREKDLPRDRRRALGHAVAGTVAAAGATLIVASDCALASALGTSWVHLAGPEDATAVPPSRFGRSCHDLDSIVAARREGAEYATISPVFPTGSKPGYGPPIGLSRLGDLAVAANGLPLYALGGITPESAAACLDAGVYGVAVMGAVMASDDPAGVTAEFVKVLRGPAMRPADAGGADVHNAGN